MCSGHRCLSSPPLPDLDCGHRTMLKGNPHGSFIIIYCDDDRQFAAEGHDKRNPKSLLVSIPQFLSVFLPKMPTVTNYFAKSVTNVGPLTTVFTPASSCATAAPITGVLSAKDGTVQGGVFDGCQEIASGCVPQADKLNEINDVSQGDS